MFKKIYKIFFIFILLSTILNGKDLKKITIQLSWFDQFQFAGYYIAKEKGFYEAVGLDVTILPFAFGIDIPKEVSEQKTDFAVGRETLLVQRSKNKNIVALYALFQATPLVLLSTKDSKIKTVNDFYNKKIMTTIDDASEVSLKAMINSHSIKVKNLSFIKHSHNINDLINKKTDIISAYISKSPFELDQKGIPYNMFDPKKFGFDLYSDFLYTSDTLINKNQQVVEDFKKASLRGWKYAYDNIDESVDLIVKSYNGQNISKEALLYEAKELKKLSYYNTSTLGDIKQEKLQRIYDLYNVMGFIDKKQNIKNFVLLSDNKLKFTKIEKIYIKQTNSIKMCVLPNQLPYSAIREDKFIGFVSDYIKEIEKISFLKFVLVPTTSISQSFQYLKDNKCEIVSSSLEIDNNISKLNFTTSYLKVPFVLTTKSDIPFVEDIYSLKNKKITVPGDYGLIKELSKDFPNIEFIKVKNISEGLEKVSADIAFAHIDAIAVSWHYLQNKQIGKLKISAEYDKSYNFSIAVNKNDPILLNILNKSVHNIDTQLRDNLLNKWIYIEYKDVINYKLLTQILLVLFILGLILLYKQYILNIKNKELQYKLEEKKEQLTQINKNLEKRIEEEVNNSNTKHKILFQQSKMASMGEMIANIAHQWRQPLNNTNLLIHYVRDNFENKNFSKKELNSTVHDISLQLNYMSKVIDDFIAFFKPVNKAENISILKTIEKTIELISAQYQNKNIVFVKDIVDVCLLTLENELIQVIINILNNAKDELIVKKTKNKLIFISVVKDKTSVIINIKDNAGGVENENLNRIFEPYFTTKDESKGMGIGLYMSKEIVSKHMHGTLEVKNEKYSYLNENYEGASFIITLPIK